MDLNKATLRKIALLVGGGVVLAWLLNNFDFLGTLLSGIWALLFPFILGFVVAFLLNLPMRAIERVIFRGRGGRARRPVSFILTVLVVLAVIALVLVLLVPQLVQTVSTLVSSMPGYIQHWQAVLKPYEDYIPEVQQWLQNLNID
ncbi:MAG: AI-2E family transporter, partial [Oscillospiraceae bacterium]